jgi:hypothetical protein
LELSGKTGEKRAKAIPKDNFFGRITKKFLKPGLSLSLSNSVL